MRNNNNHDLTTVDPIIRRLLFLFFSFYLDDYDINRFDAAAAFCVEIMYGIKVGSYLGIYYTYTYLR